jgi:hypothetical protein
VLIPEASFTHCPLFAQSRASLHGTWHRPNEQVSPWAQSLFIWQVPPATGGLELPPLHPTSAKQTAKAHATTKYLQTCFRVPALDDMLTSEVGPRAV